MFKQIFAASTLLCLIFVPLRLCAQEPLRPEFIVSSSVDGETVWFTGSHGTILKMDQRNKEVEKSIQVPGAGLITGIHQLGEAQLVINSAGQILRRNDESAQFSLVFSGADPLFDVARLDSKAHLALGAFGTLLLSEDDGHTWKRLTDMVDNPDGAHFYSFVESNDLYRYRFGIYGFIVGEFGHVHVVRKHGETWQLNRLNTGINATLFTGNPLSDRWVFLAGVGGILLALDLRDEQIFRGELCLKQSYFSVYPDTTHRNLLFAGAQGAVARLVLLDDGLSAPPKVICQSARVGLESLHTIVLHGPKVFFGSEIGVQQETLASLIHRLSPQQDTVMTLVNSTIGDLHE